MVADIGSIIEKMLVLVIIMMLGYLLGKKKVITKETNTTLSRLTLDVAAAANVFYAILGGSFDEIGSNGLTFLLIAIGCNALYFVVAKLATPLLRAPKEDAGLYEFMMMFANSGFMGYPVARAVFGEQSVIYVTYFVILFNILAYSLGVAMIKRGGGKMDYKFLISPIMITTAVSFILYFLKVTPPKFMLDTADTLSSFMTPMAMMVIGASLATVPLKNLFTEWRVIPTTLIKIVLLPFIVWLILRNFITDPLMLGVATVNSGMPIASSATMLSLKYGKNEKLAAVTTFFTTVLTAATVPLVCYFLL